MVSFLSGAGDKQQVSNRFLINNRIMEEGKVKGRRRREEGEGGEKERRRGKGEKRKQEEEEEELAS